jgi:alkylresorcinol/alkylpyrone synthase
MGSRDSAGSTGVALESPSIAGVAGQFPPNPYTQSEAIRALTDIANLPTMGRLD